MIKIENNETIVDVLTKISKEKSDNIIIKFPFGHPVLHNYLSLKIIKEKTKNKDLLIVTNDIASKKIGKLLGIKYSIIKSEDFFKKENIGNNILKENYTFFEYFKFEISKFFSNIKDNLNKNKKINSIIYYRNKYKGYDRNILTIFLLSFLSIFTLLLYIFYFSVNETTIEIIPEVSIKTVARNFIFQEGADLTQETDEKIIPIEKIEKVISLKSKFQTSGIKGENQNTAKGKAIMRNLLNEEVSLVENTTLLSKKGILYKIIGKTSIPKSETGTGGEIIPGEIIVDIVAKGQDVNGKFSGESANASGGILLSLPKLDDEYKSKIFAQVTEEGIYGGNSDYIKILTDEDIKSGKSIIEDNIKNKAIKELKDFISSKNKENNTKNIILGASGIYKFNDFEIKPIKDYKIGEELDFFELEGKITITSFLVNNESILSKLKNVVNDNNIKEIETILNVNDASLRIPYIITRNDLDQNGKYIQEFGNKLKIKATCEVEYYVSKNFSSDSNNEILKLKSTISGMEVDEAYKLLVNTPNISSVKITVKPFFLKNISKNINNINFTIKK